jgi:protein-disulfide isomerase
LPKLGLLSTRVYKRSGQGKFTLNAGLELDLEAFNACLDSEKSKAVVEQDLADGRSYGVAATPTFFVNGRQVVGSVSVATFQREIEAVLEE